MLLGGEAEFVISKLKDSSDYFCFFFFKLSIITTGTLLIFRSKYSPGSGKN